MRVSSSVDPAGMPFPGCKHHHCIDEALDDTPLLQRLPRATAEELPAPKPKAPKPAKAKKPRAPTGRAAAGR